MALTDGLISVYHLNENLGESLIEDSFGSNDLLRIGALQETSGQKLGAGCLDHDGFDDSARGIFPFLPSFSISVWFNPTINSLSDQTYHVMVSRGAIFDSNTNYAFAIRFRAADASYRLVCYFRNGATIQGHEMLLGENIQGAWHHGVVTFNDNTKKLSLYYDDSVTENVTTSLIPTDGSQQLRVGMPDTTGGGDDPFDGLLDEVNIWNREILASEVTELWNGGAGIELPIIAAAGRRRRMLIGRN